MKRYYILALLFLSLYLFYTSEIKLKKEAYVNINKIFLSDIAEDYDNLPDIVIKENINFPYVIYADEVLKTLIKKSYSNIFLIGDFTVVNKNDYQQKKYTETKTNARNELENYIKNFFSFNNFTVKIDIISIEPYLDIDELKNDFYWEIKSDEYSIKKLTSLKKGTLIYKSKKYNVSFKINLIADILISKNRIEKNSIIQKKDFITKAINLSNINNPENIILNIDQIKDNFVSKETIYPGDILKYSQIKRKLDIQKGEKIICLYENDFFKLQQQGIVLIDGYLNEKIKVKLENGKEISAILKNINGVLYAKVQ